tara:strand:+ start:1471 stop:1761 length:291 start_codon:yes stop_codon:yes gene_type:complete
MRNYFTKKKYIVGQPPFVKSRTDGNELKKRLRQWQHSRSWARLICEAEKMWSLESKELKRLGAMELIQLQNEMPFNVRRRVNFWLVKYSGATRFED